MKRLVPAALALGLLACGFSPATPPARAESGPSPVVTLTTAAFPAVKAQGKPVLVDFWAPWCGPCRQQGPIVEQVAVRLGDQAVIAKVNVDEEKALASQFEIRAIPTLVLMKDGAVVQRFVGVTSADALVAAIQSAKP